MKKELLNVNKSVMGKSVISRISQIKKGQTKFDMKSLEDSFKFQFDDNKADAGKFKIELDPKPKKAKKPLNKVMAKSVNDQNLNGKKQKEENPSPVSKIKEEEENSSTAPNKKLSTIVHTVDLAIKKEKTSSMKVINPTKSDKGNSLSDNDIENMLDEIDNA